MLLYVLGLAALCSVALADVTPTPEDWCFISCQLAVGSVKFSGTPTSALYYAYRCENQLLLQSHYLCSQRYCSPSEHEAGIRYQQSSCEFQGLPFKTQYLTAPTNATAVVQVSFSESKSRQTTAVVPTSDYFNLAYRTVSVNQKTVKAHLDYCYALFIFWGIALGLAAVHNLQHQIRHRFSWKYAGSASSVLPSKLSSAARFLRARIGYPATASRKCAEPYLGCTIPPRIETVIISAFLIINVILCAVSYEVFPNNLYYPQIDAQAWRVFSDRTGYLSYANISLLWVFGVRNNLLIQVTGWGYGTFSRFHRWVARMAVLQAILHSVGYTVYAFLNGGFKGYAYDFLQEYWYTGVIATITISLLLPLSIPIIRHRAYDIFVISHIVLALITLVNLFYHTKIFYGEFDGFLWACVGVWVIDRLARLGRIIYALYAARGLAHGHMFWNQEEGLVRLDLTPALSNWRGMSPGGRAFFVYIASWNWRGWSTGGHPFTIAQWKERTYSPTPPAMTNKEDTRSSTSDEGRLSSPSSASEGSVEERYTLLIRPHRGFTAHLLRLATSAKGRQTRLLLEGPYGSAPILHTYDTVLFIVGGSGISVAISAIHRLLSHRSEKKTAIRLVWAAKNRAIIDSVMSRELAYAAESSALEVSGYVTAESQSVSKTELVAQTDEKSPISAADKEDVPRAASWALHTGRPSVQSVIDTASQSTDGTLCVVGCGPGGLMDDVRAQVVQCSLQGRDVRMFLEEFGW